MRAQGQRVTSLRVPEPAFGERARTLMYVGRIRQPLDTFAEAVGVPVRISNALSVWTTTGVPSSYQHHGHAHPELAG